VRVRVRLCTRTRTQETYRGRGGGGACSACVRGSPDMTPRAPRAGQRQLRRLQRRGIAAAAGAAEQLSPYMQALADADGGQAAAADAGDPRGEGEREGEGEGEGEVTGPWLQARGSVLQMEYYNVYTFGRTARCTVHTISGSRADRLIPHFIESATRVYTGHAVYQACSVATVTGTNMTLYRNRNDTISFHFGFNEIFSDDSHDFNEIFSDHSQSP
jgi:hypothetical protein